MENKDYEKIEISKSEEKLVEQVDVLKKQIQKMEKKINSLIAKKTIKKEKQENKEKNKEVVNPLAEEIEDKKVDNAVIDDNVFNETPEEITNETIEEVSKNEVPANEDVFVMPSFGAKEDEALDESNEDVVEEEKPQADEEPVIEPIIEEEPQLEESVVVEEKPVVEEKVEESAVEEKPQTEEETDEPYENEEDDNSLGRAFVMPDLSDEAKEDVEKEEENIAESAEEETDEPYENEDNDDLFGSSFAMPDLSDENNDDIDTTNDEENLEPTIKENQESFGYNNFEDDLNNNEVVEEESFLNVPTNDFDEIVATPVENKKVESKPYVDTLKEEKAKKPVYDFEMPEFDIPTEEIKLDDEEESKRAEEYEKAVASWSSVESSVSVVEVPKPEEKDELDYFTSQKVERQNKVEYVVNEAPKPIDVPVFDDMDFDGVDFDAPVFNKPKTELDLIADMNAEELKLYKKRRKEEQKANKQRLIREQKEIQKTRKQDAKYSGRDKRNPVVKIFTTIFVILFIVVLFIVVYGSFGVCDLLPTETYFGFINLYDFYEWLIVDTINPVCNKIGFDIITDFFEKIRDLLGK